MELHIRQYGDILRTSYFNVLRASVEDIPWRYIEDHMGTSIGRLFWTSPGRPLDVILPSGLCPMKTSSYNFNKIYISVLSFKFFLFICLIVLSCSFNIPRSILLSSSFYALMLTLSL